MHKGLRTPGLGETITPSTFGFASASQWRFWAMGSVGAV